MKIYNSGTVTNLKTGEVFQLGGIKVEKGRIIDGNGLILQVDDKGTAAIQRVETLPRPASTLLKTMITLIAVLDEYKHEVTADENI